MSTYSTKKDITVKISEADQRTVFKYALFSDTTFEEQLSRIINDYDKTEYYINELCKLELSLKKLWEYGEWDFESTSELKAALRELFDNAIKRIKEEEGVDASK
jgi:hypothetical protein